MDLDRLIWSPDRRATQSSLAMSIVERKITRLQVMHLGSRAWVNHLYNHEQLKSIKIHNSRPEGEV